MKIIGGIEETQAPQPVNVYSLDRMTQLRTEHIIQERSFQSFLTENKFLKLHGRNEQRLSGDRLGKDQPK